MIGKVSENGYVLIRGLRTPSRSHQSAWLHNRTYMLYCAVVREHLCQSSITPRRARGEGETHFSGVGTSVSAMEGAEPARDGEMAVVRCNGERHHPRDVWLGDRPTVAQPSAPRRHYRHLGRTPNPRCQFRRSEVVRRSEVESGNGWRSRGGVAGPAPLTVSHSTTSRWPPDAATKSGVSSSSSGWVTDPP